MNGRLVTVVTVSLTAALALVGSGSSRSSDSRPENVSPPTFSGSAVVGSTLTATSPGTWDGGGSMTYTYDWYSGGGAASSEFASGTSTVLPSSVAGQQAYLCVTAQNDVSINVACSAGSGTIDSVPIALYPPNATERTCTGIDVDFNTSFTSVSPSHFTVTSSPGGITATGTGYEIAETGLTKGVTYTFTVTETNSVGTSVASAPTNPVTFTGPLAPDPPTGVTATAGNGQATVSFTPPASDGCSPITGYIVTALKSPPSGIPPAATLGTGSPITVSGLTGGVSYDFSMVAVNSAGASAASVSNVVTPAAGPTQTSGGATTTTTPAPTNRSTPSTTTTPAGQSGGSTTTTTAPSSPGSSGSGAASPSIDASRPVVSVAPIKAVVLDTTKPKLSVSTRVTQPGVLQLTLLNAKRQAVGHWSESTRAGASTLTLSLPTRARKPGHYILRISTTRKGETSSKPVPVTFRA